MTGERSVVRVHDVTRHFGPVVALDRVHFDLAAGEIHGLLGENGAGKTTLARVMAGLLHPDEGQVIVDGRAERLRNARAARALGIAMVHQHFSLVPRFTGLENVMLFNRGAWTGTGHALPEYREDVEARARELDLDVELDRPTSRLGVGERQRLEILKALMSDTRVLLLDEPTAVLTPGEVEGLFRVLRQVASTGCAIVLVAHKLDEVLGVADRVTVLRRGRWILTEPAANLSPRNLTTAMVGHVPEAPRATPPGGARPSGEIVASLTGVTVGPTSRPVLDNVSLSVARGEIVGVAGVEGNGQRELAAVLAGVHIPDRGVTDLPPRVGWIPQDRSEEGLVDDFSVAENVAFALYRTAPFARGPWLDWDRLRSRAQTLIRDLDVRTGGPRSPLRTLSGGNQQKVLTGRELLRSQDLLVAESPTRGLDVGATRSVRDRLLDLSGGMELDGPPPGIVLLSSDLDEILELSDRVFVMVRGRLLPVPDDQRTLLGIGELMLGVSHPEAVS